jgi:hypothetical protein
VGRRTGLDAVEKDDSSVVFSVGHSLLQLSYPVPKCPSKDIINDLGDKKFVFFRNG